MARLHRTPYPRPTHAADYSGDDHISLEEALGEIGLAPLDAREPSTAGDPREMHSVPVWDSRRYAMVASIPPDSGRSAWENHECAVCGESEIDRARASCPLCGARLPRPTVKSKNGRYRVDQGLREFLSANALQRTRSDNHHSQRSHGQRHNTPPDGESSSKPEGVCSSADLPG